MRKFLVYVFLYGCIALPVAFLTASLFGFTVGTEGLTLFLTRVADFVLRISVIALDSFLALSLLSIGLMATQDKYKDAYLALAKSMKAAEEKKTRTYRLVTRGINIVMLLCLIGISYPFTAVLYLIGMVLTLILVKGLIGDADKADAENTGGLGDPGSLVNEVDEALRRGTL